MGRKGFIRRALLSVAGLLIAAAAAEAQSVSLGAGANYHQGDLASPCPTVTVTCAFGYWTTTGIHLMIPNNVNMTWDTLGMPAGSITVTGTAQSNGRIALNPAFSFANGNKTIVITVSGTFVAGEQAIINGLRVANFGAPSSNFLFAETNSNVITVSSLNSANSLTILGNPTVNSGSNQIISPPGPVTANAITITDAATPGILATTDLRITIPAGLNATWDTSVSVVGIAMSGSGAVSTSVPLLNYEDANKTVRLDVTTNFGSGSAVTVTGLAFNSIGADSGPVNLTVTTNGPTAAGRTGNQGTDIRTKTIVGVPSIDSGSAQVFTKGDPSTAANAITITESPGTPKINNTDGIRLIIPAGFNMTWDTSVASVTVTGTAQGAGHIAANPSVAGQYTNGNRTVTIPVLSSFASGQTAIISGLKFTNFTNASASNRLGLDINSNGVADSLDLQTIAIGAPTISTGARQIFQVGDPVTATNTITITDGTPSRTSAANNLRIKIPAGFNMEWDTTRINGANGITFGGSAFGAQTGTITYETNQIARVNLNSPLGAGQTLTIAGMRYQNFSAPSTPNNIQLEVNGLGTNCNVAGNFVAIGGAPSISSAANQAFTVNDSATPAALITVTDANGFPSITALKGITIKIPAGFSMNWNTGIVSLAPGNFGGSAAGKIAAPPNNISYPTAQTALIKVATDFAAGDVVTINGLQFQTFSAPDAPTNLDLFVDPVGSGVPDDKTIAIGRPTIALAGPQSFGTTDPSSVLTTVTVTEDPTVPRITSANGITIQIPANATLNMTWDTSITTLGQGLAFTGTGAGHVSGATNIVSYPDSKTAVIALQGDFAAGETLIINGLKVANFNAASGPGPLNLIVSASGTICSSTASVLSIGVRPKLISAITADINHNGSIDHLILTYDKTIDGTTTSVTAGLGFTISSPAYTIGAGSAVGNVVTLTLVEKGTADTDATPSISYNALVGNLADSGGLGAGSTPVPIVAADGAAPVAMSISKVDANGNGHLDSFTITFSEALATGMEDVADWKVIDANGSSDLLQGLVSIVISGKTVTFNLADSFGSAGTPVYMYTPNFNGLEIKDLAPTPNLALQQTNAALPNVVVGGDQAVGPSKVFLDASRSTDPNGQPLTFLWTQPAPGMLNDLTSSTPFFIGKAAGVYTFTVTVSNLLVSKTVSTNVTILNVPPSVDVGPTQTLTPGQPFDIVAFATSDANGDPLTYLWTQVTPPSAGGVTQPISLTTNVFAFGNAVAPTPPGGGPPDNILKFRLDVSDTVNTSSAFAYIRLNSATAVAPTADAGPDKVAFVNTPVTLDGSLSSNPSGGTLTYQWTTTLPPAQFTGGTTATPTFTPTLPGIYTFTLQVINTTTNLASFPATTTVLVQSPSNQAPVAEAHRIQPAGEITVGDLVVLDGTGSADPEGGRITYSWVQTVGPKVIMDDPTALRPSFTPVTPALYTFELSVSDGVNNSLPVPVSITVKSAPGNTEYQASLLPGAGITAGHATGAFQLQGTTNGNPNTDYYYYLEQTQGPTANINTALSNFGPLECCQSSMVNQPYDVIPSAPGTYRFRLSATTIPPELIRAYAEITVVVDPGGGQFVPLATATAPATAVAGQTVTLTGSASNPGNAFYWTQVEGPPLTMSNPNAASPTVTPIAPGQYTFALTVSNTGGAVPPAQTMSSPQAFVVMNVSPAPAPASSGGSGGGGCGFLGLEVLLLLPLTWGVSAIRSRRTVAK